MKAIVYQHELAAELEKRSGVTGLKLIRVKGYSPSWQLGGIYPAEAWRNPPKRLWLRKCGSCRQTLTWSRLALADQGFAFRKPLKEAAPADGLISPTGVSDFRLIPAPHPIRRFCADTCRSVQPSARSRCTPIPRKGVTGLYQASTGGSHLSKRQAVGQRLAELRPWCWRVGSDAGERSQGLPFSTLR